MRDAVITILHKQKDEKTNMIIHKEVYKGRCRLIEQYSVREQLGGVENNSSVSAYIFPERNFPIACGDRCVIDGKVFTVRQVSKCLDNVSQAFRHIYLSLR